VRSRRAGLVLAAGSFLVVVLAAAGAWASDLLPASRGRASGCQETRNVSRPSGGNPREEAQPCLPVSRAHAAPHHVIAPSVEPDARDAATRKMADLLGFLEAASYASR
jgi:hypothetical protein